eukprot:6205466-Pleurochrysis_carterae.AAC.2
MPSHHSYGSVAGVYAWTTWHPSGASVGSRSEATETRIRLRGASTPLSQLSTTAHCAGNASLGTLGSPAASMPMCRCKKESQRPSVSARSVRSVAAEGAEPPLKRRRVDQRSALLTTA